MQKMHMKLLFFLGATILFSALFMETAVTPATASLRVNTLASASPVRDVIILQTAELPQAAQSLVRPYSSLAAVTWNNLVVRTFQADELTVIQLSQATCYACHLETKISCLYNILHFTVSGCTTIRADATQLDHARRFAQNIVECSSCHAGTKIGFSWQASME